jgi:hypothetical protein
VVSPVSGGRPPDTAGLVKHVAEVEQGRVARAKGEEPAVRRDRSNWHECFALVDAESVESQLAYWEKVGAETEAFVRSVPSLDDTFPLPDQPWSPPNESVSMRWLVLCLIRETPAMPGTPTSSASLDGKTAFELVALAAK